MVPSLVVYHQLAAPAADLVYLDPLFKLGLVAPTVRCANLITVSSRVYHCIKFEHRPEVETAISTGDFSQVNALCTDYVAHYLSELPVT